MTSPFSDSNVSHASQAKFRQRLKPRTAALNCLWLCLSGARSAGQPFGGEHHLKELSHSNTNSKKKIYKQFDPKVLGVWFIFF